MELKLVKGLSNQCKTGFLEKDPNHRKFNVEVLSASPVELTIEIYNNNGALIRKQEAVSFNGTYIVPVILKESPYRIYMVVLHTNKKTLTRRIVIMK
jgi:hypothetical protein